LTASDTAFAMARTALLEIGGLVESEALEDQLETTVPRGNRAQRATREILQRRLVFRSRVYYRVGFLKTP
jgi:hypothetical protein